MPYSNRDDLPYSAKHVLPPHAQDIYKEAFNSAYDEYKNPSDRQQGANREETSHRVAWSAVKRSYQKGSHSKWHKKEK